MQITTKLNVYPSSLNEDEVWDTESVFRHLQSAGLVDSKKTTERRLHDWGFLPPELTQLALRDEFERPAKQLILEWSISTARAKRHLVLFAQLFRPNGKKCFIHFNDARGARCWLPLSASVTPQTIAAAFTKAQKFVSKTCVIFPHGELVGLCRHVSTTTDIQLVQEAYAPVLETTKKRSVPNKVAPHLKRLEDESIFILREAVAESDNPVMLYSVGKDSSVMLQLARKAFFPASPPFPLLHVDTRGKIKEMNLFRDHMAKVCGQTLLVHVNPDAIRMNINPFEHGSALHTDITKTEGLKQALDKYRFDAVFGGARRDEEKSRAKERIFSFRSAAHRWDPKNQRPEIWNLYNTKKNPSESFRVFPLSNWTELDIWQYIYQEDIPVVPLYFAKKRPVVVRDGKLLSVDDDRFQLFPGELIEERMVRFRTLGCYPLTAGIESTASTLPEIILELVNSRNSERQGRAIDSDASASMEKKKQEGYF